MPINTAAHRAPSAGRARLPILIAAWLLIAAMALIGSGLPETAHAQAKRGAIPSPTLASNVPGQFVITWATPDPAPTDYRIRWANTDLGFPSYTAANEPEQGNEYPLGDVNTLTLSNLTPGDSYKVQIRSRYYNADRSVHESSGPWTATATIRVMDEPAEPPQSDDQERTPTPMPMDENDDPPAAPMGLTVSRVGHSVLTLTWNDPQDANITGYRILRGLDADSLSTIQADTGSNGTQYQDDTVAPETTYFYAILALSANGDGAQSTTLSATTAQAPKSKEERPRVVPSQRNILTAEVQVSDVDNSVTADLVVTLANVFELTTVTGPTEVTFTENGGGRVATFTASSDEDREGIEWSVAGADGNHFSIDSPPGVLRFHIDPVSPNVFPKLPDYEDPNDADSDNVYSVTLTAQAGAQSSSPFAVTVTVIDMDELGAISLSTSRP